MLPFIGWLLFVTWASLFSFSHSGSGFLEIPNFDKIVHFTFYAVMTVLGARFLRSYWSMDGFSTKLLFRAFVFAVAYGILIEVLQHSLTTTRQGDMKDALANTLGALVAVLFLRHSKFGAVK